MANNQTFYQQLTRLFRSGPAIRRKIKGQDYKNYYDNAVMQSNLGYNGPSGMGVRRENSPFSILGQYGLIERNARYSEFCFDADTLVYTTKGAVSIKELADKYSNGEIFNVWSYDHNLKQIVISTAHHPRMTREGKPQKLVRIEFDDGGSVTTTLDHKFLLRDGTYIEAANLKASDALMPFYMRRVNGNYHHVYLAKSNKNSNDYGWKSEHILIAESVLGRVLNEDEVVHHIDFNPENNDPSNLKVMSIAEHKKFHASLNNRHKFNKRNRKHSAWMKSNNPVKRLDINLDRIFDVANTVDFSLKKTSEILCADYNVIKRRLREVGYANWHEFASNRGNLTTLRNASRVLVEMREPTLENLRKVALTSTTIYEASSKLQCTENSIRRFLKRNGNQTWLEFKESNKAFRSQRKPSVTYQDICSAVSATDSKQSLADKMGVTPNMIMSSLENAGFQSFSNWLDNYKNHKVLNVVFLDEERVVYNLTVDGHHNLAVGSLNGSDSAQERPYSMVICRQSEMEYTSEIATALDIYADEACSGDENGKCFHIFSENPQIQRALEELFYEVYNIDFEARRDVRNLVKNGDFFRYIEVVPEHGVIMSEPIPVNEIEREEGYDPNDPHAVRFKLLTRGGKYLQNWQVLHFRILANDLMLPYGTSFLESIRRTWRQLVMMEDAMLVYRVVRSPERRVFYIDVSTVASTDVASYMEAVKEQIRGNSIVDKLTGRMDVRNNPVSVDDDYFMPTRPNSNTKIETLAGGQHVSATEDVEYIRSKLISGLKVPKAYLGFDENLSCFTPDTKVSLLDGRELTMPEIRKELLDGKELWTYSIDLKTKAVVPGKITDSWEAKIVDELVEVTLDNGEVFECTPEHKWLNREGFYVEAQNLEVGTSLMPLYRRITGTDTGKRNLTGYEEVYNPATEKWEFTHKLVDAALNSGNHLIKNRRVIHHKDFDKRNNSPINLVEMNFLDHRKLHQEIFAQTKQKALSDGKYSGLNNGWAKKTFEKVKPLYNIEMLKQWCSANKPNSKKSIISGYGLTETWLNRLILANYDSYKSFAEVNLVGGYQLARKGTGKVELSCVGCGIAFKVSPSGQKNRKHCNEACRKTHGKRNHKVISVKKVSKTTPVWDITVDKYHNFALSNGVFVKNSKATLAQEDVRFSRTIVNLQKLVIAELNKLAILHLFAIGFVGEDLLDFELSFSNPSTVALQQKLALTSSRLDAAAKAWDLAKETGMMDMEYIQRDILGFRAEDIVKMRIGAQQDQIRMAQLKALLERKVKEDTDDEAMVDAFDPSNYEVPGSPIQNMPTNQSNGVNVADNNGNSSGNGKSRPHSSPNQDKVTKKSVTDPSKPPVRTNASPNIDRLKTQARRNKEFTGNRALSMPDFAAMLSQDNRYAKDPYDMKSFGKLVEYRRPEFVGDVNSIPYGINRNVYYSLLRFAEAHGKFNQQTQGTDIEIISEGTEGENDEDVLLNLETVFAKE